MKKILISLITMAAVAGLIGGGAFAYFNDTETSSGNTFTAGTLDLKVDGKDDGTTVAHVTLSDMKPCADSGYYKWVLKNDGSLPGKLSVTFGAMTNNENGIIEPEIAAEAQPYGYFGARPTLGHPTDGELGEFLKPGIEPSAVEGMPGVTIIERNATDGWFIASVEDEIDTGGTIGWGPKTWSVPSLLYSQWAVGPPTSWGVWGLNSLGGKTYGTLGYLAGDVLNPGAEVGFFLRVRLDCDLRSWDGCAFHDIDDNVIQGDSVVFNIIFKLEQLP